jgi:broad specificity phosphatase PhoE
MTQVLLIRHGQAGQLTNYDLLSELGWQQARLLGEGWRHLGDLAHLSRGTMRRQRETMEAFSSSYGTGLDVIERAGFDEFDHEHVLAVHQPELQDRAARMQWLAGHDNPGRAIRDAFRASMERWASAGDDPAYDEPYPAFQARAQAALDEVIAAAGPEGTAAVITSGGVISTLVSGLLGVPAPRGLDLCWSLVNTGVTRLRVWGDWRSLDFLNNYTHLPPDLVTHR